jgi:hypothetical protein
LRAAAAKGFLNLIKLLKALARGLFFIVQKASASDARAHMRSLLKTLCQQLPTAALHASKQQWEHIVVSHREYRLALKQQQRNQSNPDVLFFWIPKSAGTSINDALESMGGQKLVELDAIEHWNPKRGIHTFGHISTQYLLDAGLLCPDYFARSWKFAIVRNPFDRAVSVYEYFKKVQTLPQNTSFKLFCHMLAEHWHAPVGGYHCLDRNHMNPQVGWLLDAKGTLMTDDLIQIEAIETLPELMKQRTGLTFPTVLNRLNPSNRKAIAEYYDDETLPLVQHAYAKDFEVLGYSKQPYW